MLYCDTVMTRAPKGSENNRDLDISHQRQRAQWSNKPLTVSPSPSPKVQEYGTTAFRPSFYPPAQSQNSVKSSSPGPVSQRRRNAQNSGRAVTSAASSPPVMSSLVKYWLIWLSWVVGERQGRGFKCVCRRERVKWEAVRAAGRTWLRVRWFDPSFNTHTHTRTHTHTHSLLSQVSVSDRVNSLPVPPPVLLLFEQLHTSVCQRPPTSASTFHLSVHLCGLAWVKL